MMTLKHIGVGMVLFFLSFYVYGRKDKRDPLFQEQIQTVISAREGNRTFYQDDLKSQDRCLDYTKEILNAIDGLGRSFVAVHYCHNNSGPTIESLLSCTDIISRASAMVAGAKFTLGGNGNIKTQACKGVDMDFKDFIEKIKQAERILQKIKITNQELILKHLAR